MKTSQDPRLPRSLAPERPGVPDLAGAARRPQVSLRHLAWMRGRAFRLALGGLLLLGPGRAAAGDGDLAEIKARGTLRVLAHFDDLRPEFFSTDQDAPGFDHELLAGFARLNDLELEVIEVSGGSDRRLAALREGRGDIAAGRLAALPERRRQFGLTIEVFPVRWVLVTRYPTPALQSLDQLRNYEVGTVRTSAALVNMIEAAGVPPGRVDDAFEEPSELMGGLKSGRVQAVVSGIDAVLPAQREDPAIRLGAFVGPPTSLVYGVRKESIELLSALDDYLANARRTLTWNRLVVKYFGDTAIDVLKSARGPGE